MKGFQIPLSQGKVALISPCDLERVTQYTWSYHRGRNGDEYAVSTISAKVTGGKPRQIRLHRFILNASADTRIDHINGSGLDNRRDNLRFATSAQNQGNKRLNKNNSTGFKGVSYDRFNQKFMASICIEGKTKTLGRFSTAQEAAAVYDQHAQSYFGEFALTNSQLRKERVR